ncbi:SRPBCC family protein [Okibacterium fritillariae]|uniref:SRPBCC family protein n=1 Tax=Okibacterium fritillariae TaxID=123320 RepID=UPI0040558FF7
MNDELHHYRPEGLPETDVYLSRTFAAPVERVFAYFTEPDLVATWFGPETFTTPRETVEIDAREGGVWKLAMQDPETHELLPIDGVITAFEAPTHLAVRLDAQTGDGAELSDVRLDIRFQERDGHGRLTLHETPFDLEGRHQTEQGWRLSFDKLDAELAIPAE